MRPGQLVTVLGMANVRGHLVVGFSLGKFGTLPYTVLEIKQEVCKIGAGEYTLI